MVNVKEGKIIISTYREPAAEEMPMFAENRVHQRTSGNPYPNHIVSAVDREHKEDKEYVCITLENEYIRIEILPEIGGRIYSAYDKTTGYDFFYKQHVIKPALIGCLGSWVSGGMEFNYPFHHRPSTFMPTDYSIENMADGSVAVWLSEHDPMHRMKGMVGIILSPGESKFETRVKLFNRTPETQSFLWWENTAVPVNKSYQIFYPKDVSYVNFHYKRSVTTYPVATNALGVFNGIRYDGETDISMHKSTIQPTSYFCAPSKYDFFGGYDHSKDCGVVHIANHHTAPGKKMFTWAYNQLSESWENALTDTDGAYAELMAGSYSDNQPDFAWIEPFETKNFSQFWYPISKIGIPCYANLNGAVHWDECGVTLQMTANHSVNIKVFDENKNEIFSQDQDIKANEPVEVNCGGCKTGYTICVTEDGKTLIKYTEEKKELYNIPDTTADMPNLKEVKTAQELYLEGVHVFQYRDPAILPDAYWKEALLRDGEHIDSLIALSDFYLRRCKFDLAMDYINRAEQVVTKYNKRPTSGKLFFTKGLVLFALDRINDAYDSFYKASWNMDYYSASMTYISAIDGQRCDFDNMICHAQSALKLNADNMTAKTYLAIANMKLGKDKVATNIIEDILSSDSLNHFARYIYLMLGKIDKNEYYCAMHSDASQTCIDIAIDLENCGMKEEAKNILLGVCEKSPMVYYALGDFENAENTDLRSSFASRIEEYKMFETILEKNPNLPMAHYYFGCMLYAMGDFEKAYCHFEISSKLKPEFYISYRNMAVALYSHLNEKNKVLPLLRKALELKPKDGQLVFETAYVMGKLGVSPCERIEFIKANTDKTMRDDICIELARAYNQNGEYEKTIELFDNHVFVPCEGGEHAVAEQYMFAYHAIGRRYYNNEDYNSASEMFEKAQVLPQNLGAGLWNECRLVPHQFYLALCYDKLGKTDKANEIYEHILKLEVDYFSNMHLPELPYYQACVRVIKDDFLAGRAIIDKYQKIWNRSIKVADAGYFGTTPFFISYCDDASTMRKAYYSYLLGFANRFMGNNEVAKSCFSTAHENDKINLFYDLESELAK